MDDHDILIEIKVKMERVILDVSKLNNSLIDKIEKLENFKAEKMEMNVLHQETIDRLKVIDEQIESLNKWRYYIAGGMVVVVPILNYIMYKYL